MLQSNRISWKCCSVFAKKSYICKTVSSLTIYYINVKVLHKAALILGSTNSYTKLQQCYRTAKLNNHVSFLQRGALYVVCKPPRSSSCSMAAAAPCWSEGASSPSLSLVRPPQSVPPTSLCSWPSVPPRWTACEAPTPSSVAASTVSTDSIWLSLSCQTGRMQHISLS